MTNAQKWVFIFLVIFMALFALSKLTEKEDSYIETNEYYEESQTEPAQVNDGLALIRRTGCVSCHGSNLEGSNVGPSLQNIAQYWSRDGLINYLRNPSSYEGGERFKNYKAIYSNVVMPPYDNVDVKDLGKMAEYILSLSEKK